MSGKEIELGDGNTSVVSGLIYFRRDVNEKWEKVNAKIFYIDIMCSLRLCSSVPKEENKTIASITITPDLVTVGPLSEKNKVIFHLANNKKQVHLATVKSSTASMWVQVIECLVQAARDPTKYTNRQFLQEQIASLLNSENTTGQLGKVSRNAKQTAKLVRALSQIDIFKKQRVELLQSKVASNRDKVVYELLCTEQSYLYSLNVLSHAFKQPMKHSKKNLNITDEEIASIFCNLDEIISISTQFFEALLVRFSTWSSAQKISDVILNMIPHLKAYSTYSTGYANALSTCSRLNEKNTEFKTFVDSVGESPICRGLVISSFLILPIQRIPRYILLTNEIIKETPPSHSDLKGLEDSLDQLKKVAQDVNLAPKQQEILDKTKKVIQNINKYKEENLLQDNRTLILEGDFVRIDSTKGKLKTKKLLLFSDLIVFTDKSHHGEKLKLDGKISISHLQVSDITSSSEYQVDAAAAAAAQQNLQHGIKIINSEDGSSFNVYAESAEEKKRWLDAFKSLYVELVPFNPSLPLVSPRGQPTESRPLRSVGKKVRLDMIADDEEEIIERINIQSLQVAQEFGKTLLQYLGSDSGEGDDEDQKDTDPTSNNTDGSKSPRSPRNKLIRNESEHNSIDILPAQTPTSHTNETGTNITDQNNNTSNTINDNATRKKPSRSWSTGSSSSSSSSPRINQADHISSTTTSNNSTSKESISNKFKKLMSTTPKKPKQELPLDLSTINNTSKESLVKDSNNNGNTTPHKSPRNIFKKQVANNDQKLSSSSTPKVNLKNSTSSENQVKQLSFNEPATSTGSLSPRKFDDQVSPSSSKKSRHRSKSVESPPRNIILPSSLPQVSLKNSQNSSSSETSDPMKSSQSGTFRQNLVPLLTKRPPISPNTVATLNGNNDKETSNETQTQSQSSSTSTIFSSAITSDANSTRKPVSKLIKSLTINTAGNRLPGTPNGSLTSRPQDKDSDDSLKSNNNLSSLVSPRYSDTVNKSNSRDMSNNPTMVATPLKNAPQFLFRPSTPKVSTNANVPVESGSTTTVSAPTTATATSSTTTSTSTSTTATASVPTKSIQEKIMWANQQQLITPTEDPKKKSTPPLATSKKT
eukprot:TRINITY_DN1025_c1_g1_i1.p1 TRINITY_DN1025_c1_g1~~TRINITY_DN1025_c1_g1_i1.p1  ORF type:complete len:1100 (+),score=315.01 TRINITY_DN1025_c1_g1_i1:51-3350(+)